MVTGGKKGERGKGGGKKGRRIEIWLQLPLPKGREGRNHSPSLPSPGKGPRGEKGKIGDGLLFCSLTFLRPQDRRGKKEKL